MWWRVDTLLTRNLSMATKASLCMRSQRCDLSHHVILLMCPKTIWWCSLSSLTDNIWSWMRGYVSVRSTVISNAASCKRRPVEGAGSKQSCQSVCDHRSVGTRLQVVCVEPAVAMMYICPSSTPISFTYIMRTIVYYTYVCFLVG